MTPTVPCGAQIELCASRTGEISLARGKGGIFFPVFHAQARCPVSLGGPGPEMGNKCLWITRLAKHPGSLSLFSFEWGINWNELGFPGLRRAFWWCQKFQEEEVSEESKEKLNICLFSVKRKIKKKKKKNPNHSSLSGWLLRAALSCPGTCQAKEANQMKRN